MSEETDTHIKKTSITPLSSTNAGSCPSGAGTGLNLSAYLSRIGRSSPAHPTEEEGVQGWGTRHKTLASNPRNKCGIT